MNEKKSFDPIGIVAGVLLAVTAVLNSVAIFFLPDSFSAIASAQRVSSVGFVIGGVLLVGICGIMAVFGPNPKKWIFLESVLALANVVLVILNLIRQ